MSETASDTPIYDDLTVLELELTDPTVTLLNRYPFAPCDGHEEPTIQALLNVTLPNGGTLQLCGNCGTRTGLAKHQNLATWLREEKKTEGSDH